MQDRKITVKFNQTAGKWAVIKIIKDDSGFSVESLGHFNTRQQARDYQKAQKILLTQTEK